MPKATLEFNLPEEKSEFNDALKGICYLIVLQDLDNYLRSIVKYGEENPTKKQLEIVEKIRSQLHELAQEREINIWQR